MRISLNGKRFAVLAAFCGLVATTGCGVQQLASDQIASAVSQGLSQAGVQLGGVDVQSVVNSFLAQAGSQGAGAQ